MVDFCFSLFEMGRPLSISSIASAVAPFSANESSERSIVNDTMNADKSNDVLVVFSSTAHYGDTLRSIYSENRQPPQINETPDKIRGLESAIAGILCNYAILVERNNLVVVVASVRCEVSFG